jgi:imidazoleglycerol-phosphate dehydratase
MHKLYGKNTHHIIEGCFKSLGRVLGAAVSIDPKSSGEIPSSKGVL